MHSIVTVYIQSGFGDVLFAVVSAHLCKAEWFTCILQTAATLVVVTIVTIGPTQHGVSVLQDNVADLAGFWQRMFNCTAWAVLKALQLCMDAGRPYNCTGQIL